MKKLLTISTILTVSGLLASCSSVKDLNEKNITKALNTYYQTQDNYACLVSPSMSTFDRAIDKTIDLSKSTSTTNQQIYALLKANLLTKYDKEAYIGIFGDKKVPGVAFKPSAELEKHMFVYKNAIGETNKKICFGTYAVNSITDWDEPIENRTNVRFKKEVINVDPIFKTNAMLDAFPKIKNELSNISDERRNLILKNTGWVVKTGW